MTSPARMANRVAGCRARRCPPFRWRPGSASTGRDGHWWTSWVGRPFAETDYRGNRSDTRPNAEEGTGIIAKRAPGGAFAGDGQVVVTDAATQVMRGLPRRRTRGHFPGDYQRVRWDWSRPRTRRESKKEGENSVNSSAGEAPDKLRKTFW